MSTDDTKCAGTMHLEGLAADGEPIPEPTGPGIYVEQNSAAA